MNRRNIMPEIEMTGQAYQAKKVTRDGLKRQISESENFESQEDEMGEDEIEESSLSR